MDKKIPRNEATFDKTPKVRVQIAAPLPSGASLVVFRNGSEVGVATRVTDTLYEITDSEQSGRVSYLAEVRMNGLPSEFSRDYTITVLNPNQAWSSQPNVDGGYAVGNNGSVPSYSYNEQFYIGVIGDIPPSAQVEWTTEWDAASDGDSPPNIVPLPPGMDGGANWRLRVEPQYTGTNFSSGTMKFFLWVNGQKVGDTLQLTLSDVPNGYEDAAWAVWTADNNLPPYDVYDSFTGAAYTYLPDHIGEVGTPWQLPNGLIPSALNGNGRLNFMDMNKIASTGVMRQPKSMMEAKFNYSGSTSFVLMLSFSQNAALENMFAHETRDGPTAVLVLRAFDDPGSRLEFVRGDGSASQVIELRPIWAEPEFAKDNVFRVQIEDDRIDVILNDGVVLSSPGTWDAQGRQLHARMESVASYSTVPVDYLVAGPSGLPSPKK